MATTLIYNVLVKVPAKVRLAWWVVAFVAFVAGSVATGQEPRPTFRGGVDLVTIRATVRDAKGRPVTDLQQNDFELYARGIPREIVGFDRDPGPIGVALLFDVSGSMDLSAKLERARESAYFLVSSLRPGQDEAAVYAFDSTLHVVQPFTTRVDELRGRFLTVEPWGVTSLHDAIAAAAESVSGHGVRRRALVVLTDGIDTSSKLDAAEVSRIASAIDVPVYVMTIVPPVDRQMYSQREAREGLRQGSLSDLARWTGGQLYSITSPAESSGAARRIVDELRHQYLIAIEPGGEPGWHPLEVRTRRKDHTVQARSGYVGLSRPTS